MTTLLVTELRDTLSQDYKLDLSGRYHIGAFIPYIYIHNSPAGDFTLNVTQGANVVATI